MQILPEIQCVTAGEYVFRQGEMGDRAYLIESGRIEISAESSGETRVLSVLKQGDVFGEMTLIDSNPRSATAKALDDCSLVPITRALVETKLGNADPLTRLLLKLVLSRYRDSRSDTTPTPISHERTLQQVAAELNIATELRQALQDNELEVHYQPIVRLTDQTLAGFEALARWNQRNEGYVPPPKFIAVAEETGLILPLGRWVLEQSCLALQRLQAQADMADVGDLFMSINVAAGQLYHRDEAQTLLSTIKDAGATPQQIKLEITETALLEDPQAAARAMEILRDQGIRLAIDDFGTGYSGLNYLYRFPLHTLKIDRSFIARLPEDESCLRLVRAILGLCREMNLAAIAEGVELPEQAAALRALGCELAQGYLFARPLPESEARRWLVDKTRPAADNAA
ncbi:MAG: EAL domain-containing protein [Gammaproteobacteria bacterium]|nr:EAL domain-containing protein [Gammaproteobacteria bacterium]